jgi:hypothetical protein
VRDENAALRALLPVISMRIDCAQGSIVPSCANPALISTSMRVGHLVNASYGIF